MKKLISLLMLLPCSAMAATLIESMDMNGNMSQLYIEGNMARMEMPNKQGYMVVDTSKRTMRAVIPEQKMVMDMSDMLGENRGETSSGIDFKTSKKGSGPKIAGYSTEEYTLTANSKYCGSLFISAAAMRDADIAGFADTMISFSQGIRNRMAGLRGMMGQKPRPCQEARTASAAEFKNKGFPMRIVSPNKRVINEVKSINKNAKLPANAFSIPSDYAVTNPNQMMQDAMKQMPPGAMEMMRQRMQQMNPQ